MATIKSIEEKAKAYDGLIERLKDLKFAYRFSPVSDTIEEIFPELKESEDERIRKEIISYIKSSGAVTNKKWIAWLEKQGKKTKPIEGFNTEFERQVSCLIASAMNKDYEYTKDFVKWTSDALLNYAKLEIEKNSMGISEATKQKLEDNLNKALEKETPESWNRFLEKQGEQNPVDVRTIGYWHVEDTEQKSSWSEEDEKMIRGLIVICDEWTTRHSFYPIENCEIEKLKNWLKSLKGRVQPKQEWKQENTDDLTKFENSMMHIGNSFFGDNAGLDPNDTNIIKEQANLLLELVPKQEWSKEDENNILFLTSIIEECFKDKEKITLCGDTVCANFTKKDVIDRLKSLRPQSTWKPSDEQIKACKEVYADILSAKGFDLGTVNSELNRLEEELKKLKA